MSQLIHKPKTARARLTALFEISVVVSHVLYIVLQPLLVAGIFVLGGLVILYYLTVWLFTGGPARSWRRWRYLR